MHSALPQNQPQRRLPVPKAPVFVMDGTRLFCLTLDGEFRHLTAEEAKGMLSQHMPIACHAPQMAARLGIPRFHAYDVLELYAFVHPGKFCVPTPGGIARAMGLLEPETAEDRCLALRDCVRHLLADLTLPGREEKSNPAAIAAMMGLEGNTQGAEAGWPWAPVILAALGRDANPPARGEIKAALRLWDKLPEWAMHAPEPPPGHHGVGGEEARERLRKLLARQKKEDRPQQSDYAAALAEAFAPCDVEGQTHVVMAEAGTGTGKTLGYLAPATVWAEKNGGAVWVSTFTRNLQKQVEAELDRLYADPVEKSRRVVTRKGRENYLCLLNFEDVTQAPSILTHDLNATALGLMARWAAVTEDGDLAGRDFPGWLPGLVGWNRVQAFADRRGECIYSACPHFNKCFVEKSIRKAKRADIVIANHALVMHQAANGAGEVLPGHYVFDEGHHLFEAADSAFCAHLDGRETADLRRWLLGAETAARTRARGIARRLEDLIADDDSAKKEMDALMDAARCLPGPLWRQRLNEGSPKGVAENFLSLCRQQVYARNKEQASPYALETAALPPIPGLFEAAYALSLRLKDLQRPMLALARALQKKLEDEPEDLSSDTRERIHFLTGSLTRRARDAVGAWIGMLEGLCAPVPHTSPSPPTQWAGEGRGEGGGAAGKIFQGQPLRHDPPHPNLLPPARAGGEGAGRAREREKAHVDWLEVSRAEGKDEDAGLYRYFIDPAAVFAEQMKPHARGVVVTSATLRDASEADPDGWQSPFTRAGVRQFSDAAKTFHAPSPFDYAGQTRIIVVRDVKKDNPDEVAAAFRALFMASGGGALGIFTAVQRLRAVHRKIIPALEEANLPLYAQHADALDTATLIDIFRAEENACLLGTDATRDGIDVPGRSLRLVVYDRVPWPRPTILHKARREHFGAGYEDMLTRFKLKQAYGRLVRKEDDRGVFVMLDGAMPSRMLTAFPEGVEVLRTGLKEAVELVHAFVGTVPGNSGAG